MHTEQENGEPVPHLSKEEARAASPAKANRNVMVISMTLVFLALAIVVGVGISQSSKTGADKVNADNGAVANVSAPNAS